MPTKARSYVALTPGDPAPWFHQRCGDDPAFAWDAMAGRYLLLGFLASSRDDVAERALKALTARRGMFDDTRLSFFGVTMDRRDDSEKRLKPRLPGIRYFFDFDGTIGKLYGALPIDMQPMESNVSMRRFWVVVSPSLRVLRLFPMEADGAELMELFAYLKALPAPELAEGVLRAPPLLLLDKVFEPELCTALTALLAGKDGPQVVEDDALIRDIQNRTQRRVLPEVLKTFQFRATRMENFVLTVQGTGPVPPPSRASLGLAVAHRRFCMIVGLNDDYSGGGLRFPEYGAPDIRLRAGEACIFSAALLTAQQPVTEGTRLAFMPYLHDDESARLREANRESLG